MYKEVFGGDDGGHGPGLERICRRALRSRQGAEAVGVGVPCFCWSVTSPRATLRRARAPARLGRCPLAWCGVVRAGVCRVTVC
jgi:hypothetical protein